MPLVKSLNARSIIGFPALESFKRVESTFEFTFYCVPPIYSTPSNLFDYIYGSKVCCCVVFRLLFLAESTPLFSGIIAS